MTPRLGKRPATTDARDLLAGAYIDTERVLAAIPASFGEGWRIPAGQWGTLGNDQCGNCVAEGTLVAPSGTRAAFRIPYRGPMLTLRFASGKHVSVTPNHAVLTPRGFTQARFLKKGDDAIGADGAQVMQRLFGGEHRDHSPAPVEQVFATLRRSADRPSVSQLVMEAVDFHGDERFVNGDVDVVTADSLLKRESLSALGKPDGQQQVGSTSESEAVLHRDGASFQRRFSGGPAALGGVGRGGHLPSLVDGQCRVAESERRALGAHGDARLLEQASKLALVHAGLLSQSAVALAGLVAVEEDPEVTDLSLTPEAKRRALVARFAASGDQPALDGAPTDAHLASDLIERFPGLVATDRLVDVDITMYEGHVYDLSTDTRWFAANGFIVHNCVFAGAAHETMMLAAEGGRTVTFTDQTVLGDYSAVTGYDPAQTRPDGSNPTDQGTDVRAALGYRLHTGIADAAGRRHQIAGYAKLDHTNYSEVIAALHTFGTIGIGLVFPQSAFAQFDAGQPWQLVAGSPTDGGHYVPLTGRRPPILNCVTWGRIQAMTRRFFTAQVDEAWAVLTLEQLNSRGLDDKGLNASKLLSDVRAITGAVSS